MHNVRATAPELLGRSFEVSQIYQELVPYRTNRRELGFAANDEYELALCQLLSDYQDKDCGGSRDASANCVLLPANAQLPAESMR